MDTQMCYACMGGKRGIVSCLRSIFQNLQCRVFVHLAPKMAAELYAPRGVEMAYK